MKTIVVNIFGGPGAGKSTTATGVFSQLKRLDYSCELATEFAKELVWECRNETFKDELYIFAKQAHRLFRLNGKVKIIVTDRPLILTNLYATDNKELMALCSSEFSKYNNVNFLIKRTKKYDSNGRNQTEDEAKELDIKTQALLENYDYTVVDYETSIDQIVSYVENLLSNPVMQKLLEEE